MKAVMEKDSRQPEDHHKGLEDLQKQGALIPRIDLNKGPRAVELPLRCPGLVIELQKAIKQCFPS